MPKAVSTRPSLPTSSTDFALPPSSSNPNTPTDDFNPLLQRFRRPSLLAAKPSYLMEARLNSPLAASFTLHSSPKRRTDSISDKEMYTDSSPSSSSGSNNPTPPLLHMADASEDERGKLPSTPPRRLSVSSDSKVMRRYSHPLRTPRIQNLLTESRPEEDEVKSEAAFARLITSGTEMPMQPRTPASDRGRYPEEAGQEEFQREDTPSDDDQDEDPIFAFHPGSEPINIVRRHTPASSVNGDDGSMHISESPNSIMMDIDMPSASSSFSNLASLPSQNQQWRYTPPPTASSAVRTSKRKFDATSNDRFDPYPSAKRRAVSPSISISYLREAHSSSSSILNTRPGIRLAVSVPISIPGSAVSSAASSPTITTGSYTRPINITTSPTMRPMGLASPILRPGTRPMRRSDGEERDIEGAGDAVGGLSLT